ncbi:hypothetical protein [Sphingopyxis sp. JAI128]|uniref:hypothetical protein n=1 Tax=Sphingopyxis sp. JAI128 TaxID=2723066 RepID=UPI00160F9EF9|nr:hypothetical protein [Sphingopyxis sp. JAI128]MBB6426125.1 hypothetical protein [Sphingopyxis sp. JAI128]
MTSLWWAVAVLVARAWPAELPSLAARHGRRAEAFGKPATATLDIGPASGAGATQLAYWLSIAGVPGATYSAEGICRFDSKGEACAETGPTAMVGHARLRGVSERKNELQIGAAPTSKSAGRPIGWRRPTG